MVIRGRQEEYVCVLIEGTVYLYCGDGYMNLHMIKLQKTEYMHTGVITKAVSRRLRLR